MTAYDVVIVLDLLAPRGDALHELATALPAVATVGSDGEYRLRVALAVHVAPTPDAAARAATLALGMVRHALLAADLHAIADELNPARVLALDVATPEETERRGDRPLLPPLVDTVEAAALLGISTTAVRARAERSLGGVKVGDTWIMPRALVEAEAARRA